MTDRRDKAWHNSSSAEHRIDRLESQAIEKKISAEGIAITWISFGTDVHTGVLDSAWREC